MDMSLRMEQRTPAEWQSIIDLVADERTLQKMAGYRMRMGVPYMRNELFFYLADHWVVKAELNLAYASSVDGARLADLLREAGIEVKDNGRKSLTVNLDGYPLRLELPGLGRTRISTIGPRENAVCVSIKEESVVLLLRFLAEAMFVIEDLAENIVLEKEQEKMATTIYGQVLRVKLDDLGEQYTMIADEKFITVHIRLKPDRRLRFCVRAEKAQEMADKIESLIAAANLLNREFWGTGMRIIP